MSSIAVGRDCVTPIELYCEDRGNGRPVVLVHGWPLSGASWEKQTTALVDAGYRAIVYDRRGFGRSSKPATGYDFDTLADDLHKVLTHLDLRAAALVGFGMGTGEVARYVYAYGSRRVSCAAFIAALPPHLPRTADNPSGVDPAVLDGIRAALVADRARYLSTFFSDFCNDDALGDRAAAGDAIRLGWDTATAASSEAIVACVAAWRADFRKGLAAIDVPALVVHGGADRIFPLAATARPLHSALRDSRLVVVEGGPHGVIWTHAARVNDELLHFLARHCPPEEARPTTTHPSEE